MSALNLGLDISVASMVESMLPRFSDHQLGLLVSFDLGLSDYGFGTDGNTMERTPLHVRRYPHLLFVRGSNYTKVYLYDDQTMGMMRTTLYGGEVFQWERTSNHDTCWRADGFSCLTDLYFECHSKFSGRDMHPKAVHCFHAFNGDPKYVRLSTHEQTSYAKDAEKYSKESRHYDIGMKEIDRDEMETLSYRYQDDYGQSQKKLSGILIKGTEDHRKFQLAQLCQ